MQIYMGFYIKSIKIEVSKNSTKIYVLDNYKIIFFLYLLQKSDILFLLPASQFLCNYKTDNDEWDIFR